MADPRDDRVSAAYREMPGDGPAPALDSAIQAAARRAVGSRPGTARSWRIPVSIAAVLALAVGISLNVDREKPVVVDGTPVSSGSAEYPVSQVAPESEQPAAPAMQAAAPVAAAEAPLAKETPRMAAKESQPAPEAKKFAPEPFRSEPSTPASPPARASVTAPAVAPAPASPPARASVTAPAVAPAPASPPGPASVTAPATVTAPAPVAVPSPVRAPATLATPPVAAGAAVSADTTRAAPPAAPRAKAESARETTAQEKLMSEALETPERRLERIAELRARGLHDEADRALAEFRRTNPAYRISEEWLRRVERR